MVVAVVVAVVVVAVAVVVGGGGTQGGGINLDYMRNNQPNQPEPRVRTHLPPCCDYDPPNPGGGGGGSYDDYYTAAARRENNTGRSGSATGREGDPTIGNNTRAALDHPRLTERQLLHPGGLSRRAQRFGRQSLLELQQPQRLAQRPLVGQTGFNLDDRVPGPGWYIGFGKSSEAWPRRPRFSFWNRDVGNTPTSGSALTGRGVRWSARLRRARTTIRPTTRLGFEFFRDRACYGQRRNSYVLYGPDQHRRATDRQGTAADADQRPQRQLHGIANTRLPSGKWVIDYLTDTLGREIDFFYENNVLTQVRQNRGGRGGFW